LCNITVNFYTDSLMVRDSLFQIRYAFSRIRFSRKKEIRKRLATSFGNQKYSAFEFDLIEKYHRHKDNSEAYQVLSDRTCDDLDFDDLFMFLDRTHSKVGQQYLYDKLRVFNRDETKTQLNETLIKELSQNESFRISLQKRIEKLDNEDAYHIRTLFQEKHIRRPKWFFLIKCLSFASVLSLVLSFFYASFFAVLIGLFCVNFVFHYWNKQNISHYVRSIPQLLKLHHVASHLFVDARLKVINPNLSSSLKLLNEVKNRMLFFRLEARLQGELEIIAWFVFDLIKTLFLLEPLLLFGVLKRLDTKRKSIEAIFQFVGHVDMLISIAALRKDVDGYCLPMITEDTNIRAKEIKHPLIVNCTSNSIDITEKSILLTGSNMSGKTSFIRAIGLNIITGVTINTCFAADIQFPWMKVFSAIRINDDLLNDKSYYFEEVMTIKEMLKESENGHNLFLLDELFKGTNTVERISAGKAVLSALTKANNKVLVSTHDIELADLLIDEYELYHFSETVDHQTVGFDYKLKEGRLQRRNAIKILEINEYPKDVVKEAVQISKELDAMYLTKKK